MIEGMAKQTDLIDTYGQSRDQAVIIKDKVIITDGQAVVQSMTTLPGMDIICALGEAFIKRIDGMTRRYAEGRVIFDKNRIGWLK